MNKLVKKIFRRGPRTPEEDLKYLDFGFAQYYHIRSTAYWLVDNDDDDDGASISTVSTNATADNLPGPGRIIDVWIYQFLGRKIERFANRFTMSRLPPARIALCLGGRIPLYDLSIISSISRIIEWIHKCPAHPRGGRVVMAGLTSLVRQTKSNNIYRSAAALGALLQIGTSWHYSDFVCSVARSGSIFHVETLAQGLTTSNPVRKQISLLACLLRRWPVVDDYGTLPIAPCEADCLWPRFIELLDSYRAQFRYGNTRFESAENSLFDILRDGCILYFECIRSTKGLLTSSAEVINYNDKSAFDMLYYLLIFLVRCITLQYQQLAKAADAAHLPRMVLFQCLRWIRVCCENSITATAEDSVTFKSKCKFASVRHVLLRHGYFTFVDHFNFKEIKNFPRRNRSKAEYRDITKQHVQAWIPQTRRLLFSFEEFDRETRGTALLISLAPSSEQYRAVFSDEELGRSHKRTRQHLARHMGASENDTKLLEISWTEVGIRFVHDRNGRVCAVEGDLNMEFIDSLINNDILQWRSYKEHCRERHEWGEYLRSNLEWEWDVASSLKSLFKQTKSGRRKQARRQAGPRAIIVADETGERKLDVSVDDPHPSPPKTVEVQYKTETGEVKYMRYVADPFVEGYSRLSGELPLGSIPSVGSVLLPDAECGSAVEENPDDEVAEKTNGIDPEGALQPESCFTCTESRENLKGQFASCAYFENSALDAESPTMETECCTVLQEVAVWDDPMKTTEDCAVKVPGMTVISQAEARVSAHAMPSNSSYPYSTEYENNGATAHDQISILSLD